MKVLQLLRGFSDFRKVGRLHNEPKFTLQACFREGQLLHYEVRTSRNVVKLGQCFVGMHCQVSLEGVLRKRR
jgi:hypothetical protein